MSSLLQTGTNVGSKPRILQLLRILSFVGPSGSLQHLLQNFLSLWDESCCLLSFPDVPVALKTSREQNWLSPYPCPAPGTSWLRFGDFCGYCCYNWGLRSSCAGFGARSEPDFMEQWFHVDTGQILGEHLGWGGHWELLRLLIPHGMGKNKAQELTKK